MSALTMGVVGESLFGTGLGEEFDPVEEELVDVFRAFDLLALPFAGLRMRMPTRTVRRLQVAQPPGAEALGFGPGPPDFDVLTALPFAQMVLQESMRLYPPAWMIV